MTGSEELLTLRQAAEYLKLSRHTVRIWSVYRGQLPYVRIGRMLRYRRGDLEALIRLGLVTPLPGK